MAAKEIAIVWPGSRYDLGHRSPLHTYHSYVALWGLSYMRTVLSSPRANKSLLDRVLLPYIASSQL